MSQNNQDYKIVIQPSKGWRVLDFQELWAYRDLLWVLTARDVKVRYKQTVLGCAWAVIQPFISMVVFSIIFGNWAKLPSEGYPYPIFVYAALLPWTFFANAIGTSANSVIGSSNLITKVYFPRLLVPLASIGAGMIDFLISCCVMLLLMAYFGAGWQMGLLVTPFLFLAVIFTALGIGTFLSALNVSYRDFRYVIPFMMQIWMYATPVVYSPSLVPEQWRWALYLNPMAGFIEGFRSAFLGKPFDVMALSISFAVALALFFIGISYFEQIERKFADVI